MSIPLAAAGRARSVGVRLRRAQRLPRRVRRAAVARGHHRHARAVPRPRGRAARHDGGHRLPREVDGPGRRSGSAARRFPLVADPDRGAGGRLRGPAALHAVRPRHLRRSGSTTRRRTSPASTWPAPSSSLFVLAGAVSALAGIYYTLRYGSARGDNATGLELQVIAAVLLGGVSIFGGRGALHGVIAGVLLIGVLSQRAAPGERHGQRHQHHHRAAARALGDVHQLPRRGCRSVAPARQRSEPDGPADGPPCTPDRGVDAPRKEQHEVQQDAARRRSAPCVVSLALRDAPPAAAARSARRLQRLRRRHDGHVPARRTSATPTSTPATRVARRPSSEFGGTFQRGGSRRRPAPTRRCRSSTPPRSRASRRWWSRPTTPRRIGDALNEARDAGTKVVTFDSDTEPQCRDLFVNQATAEGIAKIAGRPDRQADRRLRRGRDPVRRANATNQNAWIKLMKSDLAAEPPEHQARRRRLRQRRRPDVVRQDRGAAAVAPEPQGHHLARPPSASPRPLATSPTSDYKGKVALTGLGTPNQMRDYVKDGTVTAFALWNPEDLGYLAAYAAKALVDGTITGKEGDSFKAGKLGTYKVGADGDRAPRRPVRLQQEQHRQVQLLTAPGPVALPRTRPDRARATRPGKAPLMQRVCFQLQVRPGPDRRVQGTPRARSGRTCSTALADDRLAQLLAVPARRRPADRLLRDRRPWTRRRPAWRPPRSTPAGRPRWRSSSPTSTARRARPGLPAARGDLPPRGPARPPHPTNPQRSDVTMTTVRCRSPASSASWPSRSRPGPTATPAPGSRCSASPGTPRTVEEKIADAADGAPVHRPRTARSRCTSRGTCRRLRRRCGAYAEDLGVRLGHRQQQHLPGRRLQARQPHPHRPEGPAEGDRPQPRVHRRDEPDRLARPEDLAGRRHQLPRPGRHAGPPGLAGRGAGDDLRPARRGPAAGAGVQVLRAGVLPHRRPGLGHVVRARARRSATGPWSASTPATTRRAPTSSSSSPSCCGSGSSARSTSTAGSTPTTT